MKTEKPAIDTRIREYHFPKKIIWKTEGETVQNEKALAENTNAQITLNSQNACIIQNNGKGAGLLIDFGIEMQGGIEIYVWDMTEKGKTRMRVRFGESAAEAMAEIDGEKNATNDHAIRDLYITPPWLGMSYVGNTGFRFVRIDLPDNNTKMVIKTIRACNIYTGENQIGSFNCSDKRINEIFDTCVYTVKLNMQEYLWDGIKRDRLVWIGDMHPEVSSIKAVFEKYQCIYDSLDLIKEQTPLPAWMNGLPAYSMWWIIILHDLYMHDGNFEYLKAQHSYLSELVKMLDSQINDDGSTKIENHFIDWPSSTNKQGQLAGFHSLKLIAMQAAKKIFKFLGDKNGEKLCENCAEKLSKQVYDCNGLKQALAFEVMAGLYDAKKAAPSLYKNGASGFSTFLGGYILKVLAEGSSMQKAIDCMKEYWGAMLDLGATTFWEDFNIDWVENSTKLDELPKGTKRDIHGDFGDYCYKGYRHSLCHGWSSGPVSFIYEHILGIKIAAPGCKTIIINPDLGELEFAEGNFATPQGKLFVRHEKQADGSIKTSFDSPPDIEIILGK